MLGHRVVVPQIHISQEEVKYDDDAIWEMTSNAFKSLECPFEEGINAYVEIADKASQEWCQKMGIPSCKKILPEILMGGAYRHCSPEMLTVFICLVDEIFLYDDNVEKNLHKNPNDLRAFNERLIGALQSGSLTPDEAEPVIKAAADLNKQFKNISSPQWYGRFMQDTKEYCESNYWESTKSGIPELEEYLKQRPLTGAVYLFFDLCELAEGVQIEDEIFKNNNRLKEIRLVCNNLVWSSNDIISFPKEAKGTGNNILHIYMAKEQCSLPEAIAKAKAYYSNELEKLYSLLKGPAGTDQEERLIKGLTFWVKAHREWALETPRYKKPESHDLSWQKV